MNATDLLQNRRMMPPVAMQQPAQRQPNYVWGLDKPPVLRFGGQMYPPDHPLYNFIQNLLLRGMEPEQVQGNRG